MIRTIKTISSVALLLVALAISAYAQQTGQGAGNGQRNPFQEKYKYTFQLMQMVRHIDQIDQDKKYTLTSAQAKSVLSVLKPLRKQPKLTQEQAKQALKDLKKIFTAAQLNAMARIKPMFRSGNRGGTTSQGGSGQGQGGGRRFNPDEMKDFNPFYVNPKAGDNGPGARMAKRWDDFFNRLERKANPPKSVIKAKPSNTKNK
jgi:hypothetical protein